MKTKGIQLSLCLSLVLIGFSTTSLAQEPETDIGRPSETGVLIDQAKDLEINKQEASASDGVHSNTEENTGEPLNETNSTSLEEENTNNEALPPSEKQPVSPSVKEPNTNTIYQDLTGYYGVQVNKQAPLTEADFLKELQQLASSQSLGFTQIEQLKLVQPVSTEVPGNFVATLTFKEGNQQYKVTMRYHVNNTEATLPLEIIQIDKTAYQMVAKSVPYATFALRFYPFPQPSMYRSGETGIITLDYSPATFPKDTDFSVLKAELNVYDDHGNFSSPLALSHQQLFEPTSLPEPTPILQPKDTQLPVSSPVIKNQKTDRELPQTGEKNQGIWTITGLILLVSLTFLLSKQPAKEKE